jgi:hypothetical protein
MDNKLKIGIIAIVVVIGVLITVVVINQIKNATKKSRKVFSAAYQSLDDRDRGSIIVPSKKLPISQNGNDQTYDFWLYLSDNYEVSSGYKVVFIRDSVDNSSGLVSKDSGPIVCLDKNVNRLLVAVSTNALKKSEYTLEEVFSPPAVNPGFLTTYIETIPLQKWTQITVMIKDNELMLYLDAGIHSVANTAEMSMQIGDAMIKVNDGNIYISDPVRVAKGYIANFRYYNHILGQKTLRNNYNRGPMQSSWLKWFGVQQYGMRNPFYKLA